VLRNYDYLTTVAFSFGSGVGWTIAIVVVAAINEKLNLVGDIPRGLRGPGIIMVIAGIIALAFLGFSGMVDIT
ncbi:MAG: NADH:ubiquinone reductase (Na(+)-transporting) subunit E, partial [Spirochaetales bacterium]